MLNYRGEIRALKSFRRCVASKIRVLTDRITTVFEPMSSGLHSRLKIKLALHIISLNTTITQKS